MSEKNLLCPACGSIDLLDGFWAGKGTICVDCGWTPTLHHWLPTMDNLPMETPICTTHNIPMMFRPIEIQTPEQRWCGAWYNCPEPLCGGSLIPSKELRVHWKMLLNKNSSANEVRQ